MTGPFEPPALVTVPAGSLELLRGRRAVIGVPGVGFRRDVRADDRIVQGGRTFVPILSEQDYYRSELHQIEVFATLVPIERVWIEQIGRLGYPTKPSATIDEPPHRIAVPIAIADHCIGQRVIQRVPDGYVRDLRAATHPYQNVAGELCVRTCPEPDWYAWALTGKTPATLETAAADIWVE